MLILGVTLASDADPDQVVPLLLEAVLDQDGVRIVGIIDAGDELGRIGGLAIRSDSGWRPR
jgi:hypothetical protein